MIHDWQAYQEVFTAALRQGNDEAAQRVVVQAQDAGADGSAIYFNIFAPSMVTIGELWERNELNVAEEHLATAITERLIGTLSPTFEGDAGTHRGVVLLGCVAGERHALGLRMLADLFRREGWRVLFLGADVASDDWVQLAIRYHAEVVAISASTPRLAPAVTTLISALRAALPTTQIMVGGAAFAAESELWRTVGADLYDANPEVAVRRVGERQYANGP